MDEIEGLEIEIEIKGLVVNHTSSKRFFYP